MPLIILTLCLCAEQPASAQTPSPASTSSPASGPTYTIQSGDTLSSIAERFSVSMNDLMTANNITDANSIQAGQQLVIPGLEDVTGTLNTDVINFGDSFHSLIRQTQIPAELLEKLNHIISPSEFYVGANMIVPQQNNSSILTNRTTPNAGESLLEIAVKQNTDPWTLVSINELGGTWDTLPGDVLYAPGAASASSQTASGLPSAFMDVQTPNLPFKQGGTAEIIVKPANGVTLGGILVDKPLHFFPMGDGRMVALQGVYVELDPGVYPLELDAALPNGTKQSFEQMVLVGIGDEPKVVEPVPPDDPSLLESEDKQVASIVSGATPTKDWQGKFILPVGLPYCIKDWFGTPRTFPYNGGVYHYFHGGVDYGVCSQDHPFDIYAAAPGTVVFAGKLLPAPNPPRGNATIINNGWGVYTLYAHQLDNGIYVTAGQQVQAGQLIGHIGATGHVTGPHLHFEMWVNGVQVNPLDWLSSTFP
ncbi:MAG TPA: peptidoglycan DD-metalloendopeptidase family protein [Anaerolineales bacterium]|nr:peptidoglycan DD-metalloendopeptidase family protein [Anaerolineales bacterium]